LGKFYIGHLCYKGTDYYGWQKQADVPTIQETLFNTFRELYPLGRIDVKATSRTDRNVHALAQVVKFLIPRRVDAEEVRLKINEALPSNLHFSQLERINKSFKVTYLSLYKEYVYFFSPEKVPFNFVGHIDDPRFDLEKVKEAAKLYCGKHDFTYFQHRSQVGGDMVRNILESKIVKASEIFNEGPFQDYPIYCFFVRGEGFLKQMVRLMMGTLIKCGIGECSLDDIKTALLGKSDDCDYRKPGYIVPGHGLFLKHIEFPEVFSGDQLRRVVDKELYKKCFPQFELWLDDEPQSFDIIDLD